MKKILPALICVSIVCLMFAWAFTATPTAESDSSTTEADSSTTEADSSTTEADSSTTEEPGSLYYEETLRFNGVDLIKKDVPGWLINAIEEDDPIVVARTIAKKIRRTSRSDGYSIRTRRDSTVFTRDTSEKKAA